MLSQIIHVDEEDSRAKNGSLRNTGNHLPRGRYLSLNDYLLDSVGGEVTDPALGFAAYAAEVQLPTQALIGLRIKGLVESQEDGIRVSSLVEFRCQVVYCEDELTLTGPLLSKKP